MLMIIAHMHNAVMSRDTTKFRKIAVVIVLNVACLATLAVATIEAAARLIFGACLLPLAGLAYLSSGENTLSKGLAEPFASGIYSALQGPQALSTMYDLTTKHSNIEPNPAMEEFFRLIARPLP